MQPAIDNGFGNIIIEPVKIEKKKMIILPVKSDGGSGMRGLNFARVLQGKYVNRIIGYKAHTEIKHKTNEGLWWVAIPEDAALTLVELDDNETAEPIFEIDPQLYREDDVWYGGTQ